MHYLVVASPDYLARRGRPQTPADLHRHNCIRYRLPGGAFIPWVFVVQGKTVEFDVEGSVVVINDPELVINAALEGIGVAYFYQEYVASLVASGRLVSLLDKSALPVTDGFFLFYRAAGRTRQRCARSSNFCDRSPIPKDKEALQLKS